MLQLLTQFCTIVINISNNCLEVDNSNKIVKLGSLVTKAADVIIGKLNTVFTNERKTRLKSALSKSYQSLCDRDFSHSAYLLGEHLPEELRKAKSRHFLETTISKRQKTVLAST